MGWGTTPGDRALRELAITCLVFHSGLAPAGHYLMSDTALKMLGLRPLTSAEAAHEEVHACWLEGLFADLREIDKVNIEFNENPPDWNQLHDDSNLKWPVWRLRSKDQDISTREVDMF